MERRESIQNPIRLGEIYSINLNHLTAENIPENKSMKMRRFFVSPNWETEICAVSASSGGGNGGVLFLYKYKNLQNKAQGPEDSPTYAIKLTNSPQQVLFSEHILRNYGRFKVPKSLAVFLDWKIWPNDINDDYSKDVNARKLIRLLTDENKRHKNAVAGENRGNLSSIIADNYNRNIDKLRNKNVQYLLLMKCFPLAFFDATSSFEYGKLVEDPFVDTDNPKMDNFFYKGYSLSLAYKKLIKFYEDFSANNNEGNDNNNNNNNEDNDNNNNDDDTENAEARIGKGTRFEALPEFLKERPEMKEIIWEIIINKYILNNAACMRQAGELLFWDLLLGNGDRVQAGGGANVGNFFFTNKQYDKDKHVGKRQKPIALIDNDCFFPEYNPSVPTIEELKRKNLQESVGGYLYWVLTDGAELKPTNNVIGDPNDVFAIRRPSMTDLVKEFDEKVFKEFASTFFPWVPFKSHPPIKIINDLYEDTGTLLGVKAETYPRFSSDFEDENWGNVKRNLKAGFVTAAENFFRGVGDVDSSLYRDYEWKTIFYDLIERYGSSLNFDYRAFEVTRFYLQSMLAGALSKWETSASLAIEESNEQDVFGAMARFLMGTDIHKIDEDLQACIEFGKEKQWINEEKARALRVAIQLLHPTQQKYFLVSRNSRAGKSLRKGKNKNNNNNNKKAEETKRNNRLKAIRFLLVCIYLNQYGQEGFLDRNRCEMVLREIQNHVVSLKQVDKFWKRQHKRSNDYQFLVDRFWAMSQAGSAATLLEAAALFDAVKALFSDL